ncbi:MAG TPA: DUF4142 domain-containing protein [Fimbriimonadaceae bacterium]|jgi:predicted outer membrane protein
MKKQMFMAAMAAVGAIMLSTSAMAQDQTTTTTTTTTTNGLSVVPMVDWSTRISVGDEIFLMDLAHANAREIILSRYAEHNADSHGVAEFAHHMVVSHEALQSQLLSTYGNMSWMHNWQQSYGRRMGDKVENYSAQSDNDGDKAWGRGGWGDYDWNRADNNWNYIFPSDWNDLHTLRGLNGYAFDQQYVDMMAADHAMVLDKLNMHARETKNTDIQTMITNIQPKVQNHLEDARSLAFFYRDPFDQKREMPWIQ